MKRLLFSVVLLTCVGWSLGSPAEGRWYRGYGYGGYGGAQTPFSAQTNAMANVIRAEGAYNVATSQAMINIERARGSYLANQQTAMQFYYARKRAVEAEKANRLEAEKVQIQRYQEFVVQNRANLPKLNSDQFNATTGRLTWPRALQDATFQEQRAAMDSFFAARASQSTTVAGTKKMQDTIATMRDELRTRIHDMTMSDFLESRKFLDALSWEVEHTHG